MSQKFDCESLIAGLKLHQKDNYLLSFSDDGYSIGIDLNLNNRTCFLHTSFYYQNFYGTIPFENRQVDGNNVKEEEKKKLILD